MLHDEFCLEGRINLVARPQGARTVAGISVQFIHSLQTCSLTYGNTVPYLAPCFKSTRTLADICTLHCSSLCQQGRYN